MERKENYLGLSSEIVSNTNHQLQEKLALLCDTVQAEKIGIMQIEAQNRDNLLPLYGYVGKRGDSLSSPSNFTLPQLNIDQFLQPIALDHFLTQFFTLFDYQQQVNQSLTKGALVKFHSRYKYLIMAYSQAAYRELGHDIANFSDIIPLEDVASKYQEKLMKAFSVAANREGQTNALMHMAGYFKRNLSSQQKQEMTQTILQYRQGIVPLSKPCDLLKYWLAVYPDEYLSHQRYFSPYPLAFNYLREQL